MFKSGSSCCCRVVWKTNIFLNEWSFFFPNLIFHIAKSGQKKCWVYHIPFLRMNLYRTHSILIHINYRLSFPTKCLYASLHLRTKKNGKARWTTVFPPCLVIQKRHFSSGSGYQMHKRATHSQPPGCNISHCLVVWSLKTLTLYEHSS